MGIPSYFSYIIKNYSNIIRNLKYFTSDGNIKFQHLYMDCNSIIYDSVHMIEKNGNIIEGNTSMASPSECFLASLSRIPEGNPTTNDIENEIIITVIKKIDAYIDFIKPTETVFIAFDGVAPFAKMEQQRVRRYKSSFLSENSFSNSSPEGVKWNTSAITPGTTFMNKLSSAVESAFNNKQRILNVNNIIVSGSNFHGEGEHKMYKYIRDINSKNDYIAVYGLDADLIMLSIFHLKYSKNIFVFRETPDFFKHMIPLDNAPDEPHFLDIRQLSVSILCEMNCRFSSPNRINDYVFLCFFLGNDFLPHFPAMNIRTQGITSLLDIYRNCIGNHNDRYLISTVTNKIMWKNVEILIRDIAKIEKQLLVNEYNVRKKFDHFKFLENTPEEKENILLNVPIIYRAEEKYICPEEPFWESRYYSVLFHEKYDIKDICKNYYEGLEWVYNYYNSDCPSWRWKYNFHYPPLFTDLNRFAPSNNNSLVFRDNSDPVSPNVQLCYVLPYSSLNLLPKDIENRLKTNYSHIYPSEYKFQWAFCRYFWEAHPILPELSLLKLQDICS